MSVFNPIRSVFDALVSAYDGIKLTSGQTLSSTSQPNRALPALSWRMGNWEATNWQPYIYRIVWDVPTILKTQSEPGDTSAIQDALFDVLNWTDVIFGLPVDKDGKVVAMVDDASLARAASGEVNSIAQRFNGPIVNKVNVRPVEGDSIFSMADLLVHVEFLVDATPLAKNQVRIVSVGANIGDTSAIQDPNIEYMLPIPPDADRRSWTAFGNDAPALTKGIGGGVIETTPYPIQSDIPSLDGVDPATVMVRIDIVPATATVAALSTAQLQAIGVFADGSTKNLNVAALWASTAPTKATVNATGLVTGVASGSSSVSASFNGLIGACAVTVP